MYVHRYFYPFLPISRTSPLSSPGLSTSSRSPPCSTRSSLGAARSKPCARNEDAMLTTASRYETPPVRFDFSPLSEARWTDLGGGLLSRDLGVAAAMQGQ